MVVFNQQQLRKQGLKENISSQWVEEAFQDIRLNPWPRPNSPVIRPYRGSKHPNVFRYRKPGKGPERLLDRIRERDQGVPEDGPEYYWVDILRLYAKPSEKKLRSFLKNLPKEG